MAQITKFKREIDWEEFIFKINVNSWWQFYTKYPEWFRSKVNVSNSCTSLEELEKEIDTWIREYRELTDKIEYLIFYRVEKRYPRYWNSWLRLWFIFQPLKQVTRWNSVKYYWVSKDTFWNSRNCFIEWYYSFSDEYDRLWSFWRDDKIDVQEDNKIPFTLENIRFCEDMQKNFELLYSKIDNFLWSEEKFLEVVKKWWNNILLLE